MSVLDDPVEDAHDEAEYRGPVAEDSGRDLLDLGDHDAHHTHGHARRDGHHNTQVVIFIFLRLSLCIEKWQRFIDIRGEKFLINNSKFQELFRVNLSMRAARYKHLVSLSLDPLFNIEFP